MEVALSSLQEQEEIIERNLVSFIEVGNALMRIRDEELYREAEFTGFVEYLESKPWGISERHAYRQIDAAKVAELTHGTNERQARELAPLLRKSTPEVVRQTYAEIVEETGGKPTARVIREKVREIIAPQKTKRPGETGADSIRQAAFSTGMTYSVRTAFKRIPKSQLPELIEQAEIAFKQWKEILDELKGQT